jgi:AcrR family transcriptional regulator
MARPIAKDHDAKRTAILKKAAIYFANHGYDRASVSQVAQACGISKSLIYHYYNSKEQLLFDILHSHLTVVYDAVATISNRGESPEAHLRQLVTELLITYRGANAEHRLQLQSSTALTPKQQKDLAIIQKEITNIFATTIQSISPDYLRGEPIVLRSITMSLFGMLNLFYLWHQPGRGLTRIAYAEMATDILLGGLERLHRNTDAPKI